MSQSSRYTGSCHCGAVRYSVELDLSQPVIACNCSICGRSGTLLSFAPRAKLTLEQGEDMLTDYQFNHHRIHHLFCKVCGIKSFGHGVGPDGNDVAAVNVRCLADVDLDKLKVTHFDGKNL